MFLINETLLSKESGPRTRAVERGTFPNLELHGRRKRRRVEIALCLAYASQMLSRGTGGKWRYPIDPHGTRAGKGRSASDADDEADNRS